MDKQVIDTVLRLQDIGPSLHLAKIVELFVYLQNPFFVKAKLLLQNSQVVLAATDAAVSQQLLQRPSLVTPHY